MDAMLSTPAGSLLEHGLKTALHELAVSVMLVDDDATLLYANRLAHREFGAGDALRLQGGRLVSALEAQRDTLSRALRAARRGCRSIVELGAGEQARMLAVVPLPQGSPEQASMALLLSGVRDQFGPVALTLFAKAAGLTPSERDVLILLCSGLAADDIAAQRAVRISTVRTQIGSIREKVGARSVTQVIRKVSGLPPMSVV